MTSTKRQRAAAMNRTSYWASRYTKARTQSARLLIALSEVQSRITDLPEADRDAAREALEAHILRFRIPKQGNSR